MEVQTVEAQLSDSKSSTGDKFSPHEQKSNQREYSEVAIEKSYKGQNLLPFFLSLRIRESTDMLCKYVIYEVFILYKSTITIIKATSS
jgi:hypothetical protein